MNACEDGLSLSIEVLEYITIGVPACYVLDGPPIVTLTSHATANGKRTVQRVLVVTIFLGVLASDQGASVWSSVFRKSAAQLVAHRKS